MNKIKLVIVWLFAASVITACSSDGTDTDLLEGTKGGTADASSSTGSTYTDGSDDISGSVYGEGTDLSGSGAEGQAGESGSDASNPNAFMGPEFRNPSSPLSKSTIYFMYDSSQVQQDFLPVIEAHSRYLVAHQSVRMTLAGHADERGSPEYNIALGEQRAKSIARMMQAQGVSPSQLEVVSYGEEKPAVDGQDEASWQLNRRVELLYQGQK